MLAPLPTAPVVTVAVTRAVGVLLTAGVRFLTALETLQVTAQVVVQGPMALPHDDSALSRDAAKLPPGLTVATVPGWEILIEGPMGRPTCSGKHIHKHGQWSA